MRASSRVSRSIAVTNATAAMIFFIVTIRSVELRWFVWDAHANGFRVGWWFGLLSLLIASMLAVLLAAMLALAPFLRKFFAGDFEWMPSPPSMAR